MGQGAEPSGPGEAVARQYSGIRGHLTELIGGATIITLLIVISGVSYPLFHTITEIMITVILLCTFVILWNSRPYIGNNYLVLVGVAALCVGILNIAHVVSYKGMNIVPGATTDLPTQLWVAERSVLAFSMLLATFVLGRRMRWGAVLIGYLAVAALLLGLIFGGLFPVTYIDGSGLTPFKVYSEYIIIFILALSAYFLVRKRGEFDTKVFDLLLVAVVLTGVSEFYFTLYFDFFSILNLLGHLTSALAFYLIFLAVVRTGITAPNKLVFLSMKRNEASLTEQKEYAERLVRSAGAPIFMTDLDGAITSANPYLEKVSEWSDQDLKGRNWSEVMVSSEDRPKVENAISLSDQEPSGAGFSAKLTSKNGRVREIDWRVTTLHSSSGALIGYLFVGQDVTEQRESQKALQRLEWVLTKNVDQIAAVGMANAQADMSSIKGSGLIMDTLGGEMLDGIIFDSLNLLDTASTIIEGDGTVSRCIHSSPYCRLLDHASRENCGAVDDAEAMRSGKWHCYESCWNDTARLAMMSKAPQDWSCHGGMHIYAMPIIAGGKAIGVINISYGDIPRDPGELARISALYNVPVEELQRLADTYESRPPFMIEVAKNRLDVSAKLIGAIVERRLAEVKLEQNAQELSRSNSELERFAYVASHDLKEPLRMVTAYMDLLDRKYGGGLDARGRQYVEFAVDGARRMNTMIEDLLALSRIDTQGNPLVPVDLNAVLGKVVLDLGPALKDDQAVVRWDRLPAVKADVTQVGMLFQNLISNAVKFHGPLPPEIYISALPTAEGWLFSVKDNGIGIGSQHKDRVFEMFQRLHTREEYPGTGMGLAICRRIVERHGGRIWVESEEGKGSDFKIIFPDG